MLCLFITGNNAWNLVDGVQFGETHSAVVAVRNCVASDLPHLLIYQMLSLDVRIERRHMCS
jgi:hypothetical protein